MFIPDLCSFSNVQTKPVLPILETFSHFTLFKHLCFFFLLGKDWANPSLLFVSQRNEKAGGTSSEKEKEKGEFWWIFFAWYHMSRFYSKCSTNNKMIEMFTTDWWSGLTSSWCLAFICNYSCTIISYLIIVFFLGIN